MDLRTEFNLVGINHRTAPLVVRERAAVGKDELADSLHSLNSFLPAAVIVSTCNRTEVYWVGLGTQDITEKVIRFLNRRRVIPLSRLRASIYIKTGKEALRHLFSTASGLNSMILGEHEIMGQLKDALQAAEYSGMVTYTLRFIFQAALRTGRDVREHTGISRLPLSISSVAVVFAEKTVGDLSSSKMLVIGAGEAGALVAKAARMRGIGSILVASRSHAHAASIAAKVGGISVDIRDLEKILTSCNVVVTCADVRKWVVSAQQLENAMLLRPQLPLVVIDLAVPRNVQPEAAAVINVKLYNIDDLNAICEHNRGLRKKEVRKAEAVIETELAEVVGWWHSNRVRPVVVALMAQAENTRKRLFDRTLSKLSPLSQKDRYAVEMMSRALVKRILGSPLHKLKTGSPSVEEYSSMVQRLFDLAVAETNDQHNSPDKAGSSEESSL